MSPAKKKDCKTRSPRPRRATKQNRRFLDSEIWNNSDSSNKPLSSPTSTLPPPASSSSTTFASPHPARKVDQEDESVQSTRPNVGKSSALPTPKPPVPPAKGLTLKSGPNRDGNVVRSKNFIRFRFQIDCAVDVKIDELVKFLKSNMKIDGKKNNLADVNIEKRNSYIHILSKVMLKKKYLKLLSKRFLRKMKLFNYRIIEKNKRAYKIISKIEKKKM